MELFFNQVLIYIQSIKTSFLPNQNFKILERRFVSLLFEVNVETVSRIIQIL